MSKFAANSWAAQFFSAGWRKASISSFPLRHSASWWNHGFAEAMNLMHGAGGERADEVEPHALDWLDRKGGADDWFLHVHLWTRSRRGTAKRYALARGIYPVRIQPRNPGGTAQTSGALPRCANPHNWHRWPT
ncbi:MAG: hypothetical protein V3V01_02910 [Acidimicrobiales bacterium]